jgi:N-acetyl-anhydromuramyl-L-alanine amidase AmpD
VAIWVGSPNSYTAGRNRSIQYVVIHSTEGSEGPTSAEAGAAYDKRRTDGTSTHLFTDSDTAIREVLDSDRAHHARFHGNEIGIGVEICGLAGQSDAQWHDAVSAATLRITAREVAALCKAHNIPVRRLSVAEVRAAYYATAAQRPKGICGHIDVTNAYPEDNGSHTDPGPHFPWAEFLLMVNQELGGGDVPVKDLQEMLKAAGYNPGTIDGIWGPSTRAAYQQMILDAKKLGPAGPAGPMGPKGATGPVGPAGPQGVPGSAASHTHTVTVTGAGGTGPAQPLDA